MQATHPAVVVPVEHVEVARGVCGDSVRGQELTGAPVLGGHPGGGPPARFGLLAELCRDGALAVEGS